MDAAFEQSRDYLELSNNKCFALITCSQDTMINTLTDRILFDDEHELVIRIRTENTGSHSYNTPYGNKERMGIHCVPYNQIEAFRIFLTDEEMEEFVRNLSTVIMPVEQKIDFLRRNDVKFDLANYPTE